MSDPTVLPMDLLNELLRWVGTQEHGIRRSSRNGSTDAALNAFAAVRAWVENQRRSAVMAGTAVSDLDQGLTLSDHQPGQSGYSIHVRIPVSNADDAGALAVCQELLTSWRGGEIGLVASHVWVTDARGEVVGKWKDSDGRTPHS